MLVTDLDIHSKAGNSWAAALKTGRLFSNSSGGYNVEYVVTSLSVLHK